MKTLEVPLEFGGIQCLDALEVFKGGVGNCCLQHMTEKEGRCPEGDREAFQVMPSVVLTLYRLQQKHPK